VHALDMLKQGKWDLLVLSPGPGRRRISSRRTSGRAREEAADLGVCLGVQAIGEYSAASSVSSAARALGRPFAEHAVKGGPVQASQ